MDTQSKNHEGFKTFLYFVAIGSVASALWVITLIIIIIYCAIKRFRKSHKASDRVPLAENVDSGDALNYDGETLSRSTRDDISIGSRSSRSSRRIHFVEDERDIGGFLEYRTREIRV